MQLVSYFIVIPLAAAFLIPLFGNKIKWSGVLGAALAAFLLSCASFAAAGLVITQKTLAYKLGMWLPPASIEMVIDGLSAFMLITVNVVAFLVTIYSISYINKYTDKWKFYTLFCLMMAGINGVLIAGDIFNMYVFLEIAAMSAYFLVAFGTEADELEAAFKYAVMGTVASAFILLGIAFLYSYTSTLNMRDMASVLSLKGPGAVIQFVSVLFLMGFGLKAALVPFHAWLPYAHSSAPAPISAMLSGILIKVLGVYALVRIFFNVFGMTPAVLSVLIVLAVLSMVIGSIMAFGQSDIKRLLAYSSISQIGYIALGFGIATPLAIVGALFHLFNHSLFKSLLFLDSGAIERSYGTKDLGSIRDVVSRVPLTGYTTLVGAMSICGIPPLGGFWSKLIIILACIQANRPVLALVAILVSILTLGYYFKALTPALFGKRKAGPPDPVVRNISFTMGLPMIILAVLSVISFFMLIPGPGNMLLKDAAVVLSGAFK